MRKFFSYPVFLVLFLSIGLILFGSLLRHHYLGGEKAKSLQQVAVFIAEIPRNIKYIISKGDKLKPLLVNDQYQNRFKDYNPGFNFKNKRELDLLFLLNYTNPKSEKHEINLIDLRTYKSIFRYQLSNELFNKIKFKKETKFKNFALRSTFLTKGMELVALTTEDIIFKFSPYTEKIIWLNNEYKFHHTFM